MKVFILALILFLLGLVIYQLLGVTAESEIAILPNNYRGVVYILLNQNDGTPRRYEGSSRVYEIPASGILKSQFGINNGLQRPPKFFYLDGAVRRELSFRARPSPDLDSDVYACCISDGVASSGDSGNKVEYVRFFVGTTAEINSAMEAAETTHVGTLVKRE